MPHMPQLFGSSVVSVHIRPPPKPVEHTFSAPVGHLQPPATHVPYVGQTVPQVPQLFVSVWRSVQRPGLPHIVVTPVLHAHMPALQVSPEAQRRPHAPQLFTSVCMSVQTALVPMPQMLLPVAHAHAVAPPAVMQVWPGRQRLPHTPQLLVSLVRSTHDVPHVVFGAVHAASGVAVSSGGVPVSMSPSAGGIDVSSPPPPVSSPGVDVSLPPMLVSSGVVEVSC